MALLILIYHNLAHLARYRNAIDHTVLIGSGRVGSARLDARRTEPRLVGRIGKLLRFQSHTVAHPIDMAALADQGAAEKVFAAFAEYPPSRKSVNCRSRGAEILIYFSHKKQLTARAADG